ncbi:hypothetical protein LNL84_07825 [Vibrio sp. ZSDZ34]|uniref:Uncharacterized protein n=1 Tax=Vibrio gelatinilyticus TaxID=2893468 RepID=A0A9X1WA03_9VIBR|nr:hypothetical protein [Vibrio gelatinilyticus]MCJ2376743.1 hypothetical protein [Vibrio gelatinilyticus]
MDYRNKINKVKGAILSASENSSLQEIIDSEKEAFEGIRMLFATDAAGAALQVPIPHQDLFSGVFAKSRVLAYSNEIASEMLEKESMICYQRRALFDTNLLSDLPKYFKGEDLTTRSKVEKILKVVEQEYCGGFDFAFPMLENLRSYTSVNNPYPVNKVAAAFYFDAKLQGNTIAGNSNNIFEPYLEKSEELWKEYRASEDMWHAIDRRDLVYVVMLKTYYLCWSLDQIMIEDSLRKLVDFCLDELGVLPLKELYFAWKVIIGFSIGYYTPVFDEKLLKKPKKKKSIERIGALAWDLFIFRFTELLLTEGKQNNFYVPTITTLDGGLLDTVHSCKVKAMISFPEVKYVETIFEDELHFQHCLDAAMSKKQKDVLSDPKRNIKGNQKLRHRLSLATHELEKLINQLT